MSRRLEALTMTLQGVSLILRLRRLPGPPALPLLKARLVVPTGSNSAKLGPDAQPDQVWNSRSDQRGSLRAPIHLPGLARAERAPRRPMRQTALISGVKGRGGWYAANPLPTKATAAYSVADAPFIVTRSPSDDPARVRFTTQ